MFATFRIEMAKQWRRPRTYVALAVTILIPVLVTVLLKTNAPKPSDGRFIYFATQTGLFVPVSALRIMSRFLLVILVALFAGDVIASEASWGNLRALLVRPIARTRLLGAKTASASLLAFIATALIVITGLVVGGIAFGWHPLDIGGQLGPHLHFTEGELLRNLALSTVYVFWSLTSVIALSVMVSTMTDSPAGAIFAGVGLYIVSQILDGISSLGVVRYWLPTHYFDTWSDLFTRNGSTNGDLVRGALLPLLYIAVFGTVAWWWFRRKDVLS